MSAGYRPLVSILIVSYGLPKLTVDCVESVLANTKKCEVLIHENSGDHATAEALLLLADEHENVRVTLATKNTGYIGGNNALVKKARGEYICVLNNDTIAGPGWMDKQIEALKADEQLAIVGPRSQYGFLDSGFCGSPGPKDQEQEYICGWCLTIPRWVYERFGLFDDAHLTFGMCEDADLSLRVREAGFRIKTLPDIDIYHLDHRSYKSAESGVVDKVPALGRWEQQNGAYCRRRWAAYLRDRSFAKDSIIVRRTGARGDVLCVEPIARALREQENCNVEIQTACPDVLLGHPGLTVSPIAEPRSGARFINLDDVYESHPKRHLVMAYADAAGIKIADPVPRFYVSSEAHDWARSRVQTNPNGIVVVCAEGQWASRVWPMERFIAAGLEIAKKSGCLLVEVGSSPQFRMGLGLDLVGKTTLQQLAAVIEEADVVLCNDQLLSHLSVAVRTPSVSVYGCINPAYRVHDPDIQVSLWNDRLSCRGCHHELPAPKHFTACPMGTNECLTSIPASAAVEPVLRFLKGRAA